MTRQLILMRHAKSDHDDPSLSDHDRPLAKRGRRATPKMADWLDEHGCVPDLILCSSSFRTRETAELLLDHWGKKPVVVSSPDLYLSSPHTMLDVIGTESGDAASVMVLGHNPGISALASMLADRSLEMVTAAVAVFDVDDLGKLGPVDLPEHAPLSHLMEHLATQCNCKLTHFAAPKTI
ncbi:phosphohistidine phosphatase [Stieleria maiorica]|uniref:Phosphohistidine phosphatase n=1 Tax=Stieleria maiorica TaxID=2795974 RepID=A0A5B9MFI2_9BACT|nr:histidine phosphatase family protein [Stieleria maiorica]QEG00002.1 phosphohistidine phosphatase [Stieleria maiorica]